MSFTTVGLSNWNKLPQSLRDVSPKSEVLCQNQVHVARYNLRKQQKMICRVKIGVLSTVAKSIMQIYLSKSNKDFKYLSKSSLQKLYLSDSKKVFFQKYFKVKW